MKRASQSGWCDCLYIWHYITDDRGVSTSLRWITYPIFSAPAAHGPLLGPRQWSHVEGEREQNLCCCFTFKKELRGSISIAYNACADCSSHSAAKKKLKSLPNVRGYQLHPHSCPQKHTQIPPLPAFLWSRSSGWLWKSPTETRVGWRWSSRPLPVIRGCSAQHRSRLAWRSALRLCHQLRVRAGKAGLAQGRVQPQGSQAHWFYLDTIYVSRAPQRWTRTFMPKCVWLPQVPLSAGISLRLDERTSGGGRNHRVPCYPQANTQPEVAPEWHLPGLMQADIYSAAIKFGRRRD